MFLMGRGLVTATVLLVLASAAHGLYEDQAGSFDWYQQHLGPIQSAYLHSTKPRAYVGSTQQVVASLNLRDGSIAWRKLLDETIEYLVPTETLLLTVSGGASKVRAWDQNEGGLRWETATGLSSSVSSISIRPSMEHPRLAVASPQALKILDCKTGEVLSSQQLAGFAAVGSMEVHHSSDGITAYGWTAGSHELSVASLSDQLAEDVVSSPAPLSAMAAAGPAGFAVLSQDLASLCLYNPGAEIKCTPIASFAPELTLGSAVKLIATSTGFVLVSEDKARPGAAVVSCSGGTPALLSLLSSASAVSAPVKSSQGEAVAAVQTDPSGAVHISVVSTASGEVLFTDNVAAKAGKPGVEVSTSVQAVYLGTYRKKDKSDGFRVIVAREDGRVSLLQQGVSVWTRSEALGAVLDSVFVELPVAQSGSADAAATGGFNWELFFKTQMLAAKVQLHAATPEEASELLRLRAEASDSTKPVRDLNGFRKLILMLSETGSLMALHNGDGHVVWAKQYKRDEGLPQKLLTWHSFHDLQHAPQVVLLHAGQQGSSSYASIVDAHSGKELERLVLPGTFDKVLPVHQHLVDGHAEQTVYLLVAAGAQGAVPSIRLLPDTAHSRSWFAENYRSLYFWLEDSSANSLTGYGFDKHAATAIVAHGSATAIQTWHFTPVEPILGIATRNPKEAVQSSVKVLGDRSIRYKYLNPNTLLVALGSSSNADDGEPPSVTALLLDSATGRVLHSQVQMWAHAPVRLLLSEHLAVMEFWDSVAKKMAMVSMEVFDATPREFSVLDYLFNPNSTHPISSFDQAPVNVTSQAFWTHTPSNFLAVTSTQQGITSKQLLVGTITDQVYTMDVRFLDPRRPRHQRLTTQEQEERLIPYQEYLPLVPTQFATTNRQVLGLRHIDVEPSRLESTCLVLARGVDLFYTRLAPAKKYDSLEDDFSYGLLVVALLGLLVGAVVMHFVTSRSMLAKKWA